jgi:propionyl-CoA synthetase
VTRPCPGYNVKVFNEANEECGHNELGKVVIKMPLPPAFMLTLWGNDEAFIEKYLAETPGYYTTGDAGVFDEHGYLHIMTRVDDVINTCGHRISTGRLEEVINNHGQVVESAVIGYNEPLRGEMPLAYVVLKGKGTEEMEQDMISKLKIEINNEVRKEVGAFANMIGVIFMKTLPKTRSGKILRGTIRKISNRNEWKMPATIDDAASIEAIIKASQDWMETLPEDRRISTENKFISGFNFVTNTKIKDDE